MNSFLTPLNYFYTKYYGKDPLRFWSFQVAINLFIQREGKTIVETGTVREPDDWGGGNSTTMFGDIAQKTDAKLITIDNDPKKIEFSKEWTKEFSTNIEYITSDSVEFLKNFKGKIDLLYLDSLDFPLKQDFPEGMEEEYEAKIKEAQEHNLAELMTAEKNLTNKSIILIDDFDFYKGGKGGITVEYLTKTGWEALIASTQILFIKS